MSSPDLIRNDFSRVFLIEDGAGPSHPYSYQGLWKAGQPTFEQGDTTLIYIPDPDSYAKFKVHSKVPGEPGSPELPVSARYGMDLSTLLRLAKGGCDHDLQVHFGQCRDPRDFNGGWDKVLIIERARVSTWGTDGDLGALGPDERAQVNEDATFSGEDLYEVKRMTYATKAGTTVVQEVVDITICDSATCGSCGLPSDGCKVIFAICLSTGASPGASPIIVYSEDGGLTWGFDWIGSLSNTEDPNALACVGTNVIVVSEDGCGIEWADITDLLAGTAVWAEVTTGLVCPAGAPRAIKSISPTYTWIVGKGGYIYFADDPTASVTVQDAGVATTEDLNAIDGVDQLNLVAVGDNNAVVHTTNGGATWELIVGPAVGVDLNCVHMVDETTWWVGTAAPGKLFYTINAGVSWVEKTFSGSGQALSQVTDIEFSTPSVGYMTQNTGANVGRIFRTINGGYSWYVAPEGTGTIPTNQKLNAVAVCPDPNKVYAGGATVVSGDGIIIAGA